MLSNNIIRFAFPLMMLGSGLVYGEGGQWLETNNGLINLSRISQITSFASSGGMVIKFDAIAVKVEDSEEIAKIDADRQKAQGGAADTLAKAVMEKRSALLQEKMKKIADFIQAGQRFLNL